MMEKMKFLKSGPFEGTTYSDMGEGHPMMLVHGFPLDHTLWYHQAKALRTAFRIIVPDLPGSGLSPLPGNLSIKGMAHALKEIIDQEGIEKIILVGHSMGGYATLAFAEEFEDRLNGFGLFHSTAFADSPEKKEGRKRSIKMITEYGEEAFLKNMILNLFPISRHKAYKEEIKKMIRNRMENGLNALIPYYGAMLQRPDRTSVLKNSKVPVLFIAGEEDTIIPKEQILKQVSLPSISQVHLLERAGHMGMLEVPERAAFILGEFGRFCSARSRV